MSQGQQYPQMGQPYGGQPQVTIGQPGYQTTTQTFAIQQPQVVVIESTTSSVGTQVCGIISGIILFGLAIACSRSWISLFFYIPSIASLVVFIGSCIFPKQAGSKTEILHNRTLHVALLVIDILGIASSILVLFVVIAALADAASQNYSNYNTTTY